MQVTLVLTDREAPLIGKSGGEKEGEWGNRHLSRLWTGVLCKLNKKRVKVVVVFTCLCRNKNSSSTNWIICSVSKRLNKKGQGPVTSSDRHTVLIWQGKEKFCGGQHSVAK